MKIKHLNRYCFGIAVTVFLVILTGNAFAAKNATRNIYDGSPGNTFANNHIVTSPYWQVDSGSYTFIAVSHSSLSGMASQIGVKVNAITSAKAAYDTAQTFTVSAGETKRVFIIPTNHATINSTTQTAAVFLAGTTNFTYGHLRIIPQTTHPMIKCAPSQVKIPCTNLGDGFRDSTMLSYWGSVIVEAQTTGFAMEFIGDMNDSVTLANDDSLVRDLGAGIDRYMASGPNLH